MLPEAIPCPQLVKLLADKPERITPQGKPASARVAASAEAVWGVQLIGDDSHSPSNSRKAAERALASVIQSWWLVD